MIIGVPKEVKVKENRVGMVPGGVTAFVQQGHKVFVETNAGAGVGLSDEDYVKAGAKILNSAEEVWGSSEMIIKVKEPISSEYSLMQSNQILYTYLHLAAVPELANALLEKNVASVAYETIQGDDGFLPLLKPMSEVAGRMSVQVGIRLLEKNAGGKGLMIGGVPGVRRGHVVVIGGGYVGVNAAKMAIGLGARVTILDVNASRLAYLDDIFGSKVTTLMSNIENITHSVAEADLLVGAVLLAGAKAPVLVTEEMVKSMEKGSAIVDVAIDQGGSVATIKPTNHDQPTYVEHGVIHYGVTNMPGAVPLTSTYALTNVTLPYGLAIANKGLRQALADSCELKRGLNTFAGEMTHEVVANALNLPYKCPSI